MNTFLTSNEAKWRLARTIVQGVIAAIIANLADILGLIHLDPPVIAIVVPIIMAILSPIMEYLGRSLSENKEENNV